MRFRLSIIPTDSAFTTRLQDVSGSPSPSEGRSHNLERAFLGRKRAVPARPPRFFAFLHKAVSFLPGKPSLVSSKRQYPDTWLERGSRRPHEKSKVFSKSFMIFSPHIHTARTYDGEETEQPPAAKATGGCYPVCPQDPWRPGVGLFSRGQRLSSMRLITTSAEISRLAASGITKLRGLSMTSSVTMRPRRTGRQCMK